jgi:hypothetical protein
MIFDGLLSRTRLRRNMAERSELEVGFPTQVRYSTCLPPLVSVLNRMDVQTLSHGSPSRTLEGKRASGMARVHGAVSLVTMADFATATKVVSDTSGNGKEPKDSDPNSELEGEPTEKPGVGFDSDLPV